MASSNATEEQRRALREALKKQIADMRALEAAAEKDQAEQQELLSRIAAMESKVGTMLSSWTVGVHAFRGTSVILCELWQTIMLVLKLQRHLLRCLLTDVR